MASIVAARDEVPHFPRRFTSPCEAANAPCATSVSIPPSQAPRLAPVTSRGRSRRSGVGARQADMATDLSGPLKQRQHAEANVQVGREESRQTEGLVHAPARSARRDTAKSSMKNGCPAAPSGRYSTAFPDDAGLTERHLVEHSANPPVVRDVVLAAHHVRPGNRTPQPLDRAIRSRTASPQATVSSSSRSSRRVATVSHVVNLYQACETAFKRRSCLHGMSRSSLLTRRPFWRHSRWRGGRTSGRA